METASTRMRSIAFSVTTFVLLLAGAFAWLYFFDIPIVHMEVAVAGLTVFSITMISLLIYQSGRVQTSAQTIARGLTRDMLEASHDLFPELFRNSPVPYLVITEDGFIESMNVAAARLFHVELNGLEGVKLFVLMREGEGYDLSLIEQYVKIGRPINEITMEIERPDEVTRWVICSIFPFQNRMGEKRGLVTLVDVTQQKQVDQAKTEFVSLASHQLRTPLSAMRWNMELLGTTDKGEWTSLQSDYLNKVDRNIARMDALISDFLNVSRLELGTLKPELKEVPLQPFFEEIRSEHEPPAKKKNITLTFEGNGLTGTFTTDSHLLHMIVSNLTSNAVKYTREGGTVRVIATDDGRSWTCVVEDTGMGIPKDDQERIFTKLFRAKNAKAEVTEGTGLGLYVVRQAARVLRGDVTFVSEEGKGTTFTVVLPK